MLCLLLSAAFCLAVEPRLPIADPRSFRELSVHLAQANNNSHYAFVRAKFEPGEVADPWAVRFFDSRGKEVPYFVWDSVSWKVAREGRPEWGNRFALLNHHPGNSPEALAMRGRRLEAAQEQLPDLGRALAAQDEAAKRAKDSVCVALYLVRYAVPAFGKEKLTLRVYSKRQVEPKKQTLEGNRVEQRLSAAAGALVLDGLPDRAVVRWKGKELFRHAGFRIGDKSVSKDGSIAAGTHADPARPFTIEIAEGIVTKVTLRGQTNGRAGSATNWQCTWWLFPDGCFVALTGFSFDDTAGYLGGGLTMNVWEMPNTPRQVHEPTWEKPWWLHRFGDGAFAATHQFTDTPLTVGYGNNPFSASTPGSFQVQAGEKTKGQGDGLVELNWTYELTDKRIYRLFHPRLDNDGSYDLAEITDLRDTLLASGKLSKVPRDAMFKDGTLVWPPERIRAIEDAIAFVKWHPRVDWLYRQYVVGVGNDESTVESGIRQVLGAGFGWIDRPYKEEELAELLVQFSLRRSSQLASHQHAWMVLPDLLHKSDRDRVAKALNGSSDPVATADNAMTMIRKHVSAGGSPIEGTTKTGGEGWHNNPAYAGVDVPVDLRFLEHFGLLDVARPRQKYRESLLDWANFTLETLGGKPFDPDKLRNSCRVLWPNRVVMLVPLMLRAYRETSDDQYARAAKLVFDDVIMSQVETNPHGYFWAWGPSPQKAELFDPNYNVAAFDRGLVDFWSDEQLPVIGKERAARFVAAQARYLAFSGQFLDSLETDSMTAVQSHFPGGIPTAVGQVALFLHDDFAFYRGLIGDTIRWAVIDDGATVEKREGRRNLYSAKIGSRGAVFWAYGIGRDSPPPSKTAREIVGRWRPSERPKK